MKQKYLNSVNLKSQSNFPYLVMDVTKERSLPKPPVFLENRQNFIKHRRLIFMKFYD